MSKRPRMDKVRAYVDESATGKVTPPDPAAYPALDEVLERTAKSASQGTAIELDVVLKDVMTQSPISPEDGTLPTALIVAARRHDQTYGANRFVQRSLPTMVRAAKQYHALFPDGIPIVNPLLSLRDSEETFLTRTTTFTKLQCLSIISNAFLCLFPRPSSNCMGPAGGLPSINYDEMHYAHVPEGQNSVEVAKLEMVLEYFDEMTDRLAQDDPKLADPKHSIAFQRRGVRLSDTMSKPLLPLKLHPMKVSIDDQKAMIRADFANRLIGGGAIAYGCVQEEIMFSICPELVVSRLFYPEMEVNEAIVIVGSEQFAKVKEGTYAFSLAHGGKFSEASDAPRSIITCIDAMDYRYGGTKRQWEAENIHREVLKAFAGFNVTSEHFPGVDVPKEVATGNWGCGAFLGHLQLKAVLQWIACSLCGKEMNYFPFNETVLENLQLLGDRLVGWNISATQLYNDLVSGDVFSTQGPDLFAKLLNFYKAKGG